MISRALYKIFSNFVFLFLAMSSLLAIYVPVSAIDIPVKVCSSGSVENNSVSLYIKGSIGQPIIQKCNSVSLYLKSGFFQGYMAIDNTQCQPGDANNDNSLNILDIVYLINFKYKDGPSPVPDETCSGDADCDCQVNILDAVLLINSLYKSGLPPCSYTNWRINCGLK